MAKTNQIDKIRKEFEKKFCYSKILEAGWNPEKELPPKEIWSWIETTISKAREDEKIKTINDIIDGKILLPQLTQDG
jgi:hypothetical protein